jgi:tetratricopeptide (TPR) repeat protein
MPLYCVAQPGAWRALAITAGAIAQRRLLILSGLALFALGLVGYQLSHPRNLSPIQVAVLPFVTIPNNSENRDFSSGLAQTLCSALTQAASAQRSLRVVPFSEVTRSGVKTAREAFKLFGATRVVSGTIQRQGVRMHITLNVEDAKVSRMLTSATIKKAMGGDNKDDVYTLQDDLAVRTVSLLGMDPPATDQPVSTAGRTRNNNAYQSYLEGLGRLARYDKQENVDAAISHFQNALAQDPTYALASASLAEAFWRKYDYTKVASWQDKAIKQAREAAKLGPAIPRVLMVEGIIEAGTGSLEEAEAHLQKVVRLDPANAEVYLELARVNEAQGKIGAAENNYRVAVDRIPSYWAGYNRLGGFYVRHGEYLKAESYFRQALALTPDNYVVYANLGAVYHLMGQFSDATDALRRSIALQPTADAYSNLGMTHFFSRNFDEAVKMFLKAAEMDQNNALFLGNLADAYRLAKSDSELTRVAYCKAIELAQGQLAINPKDDSTRALLATYYSGLGQSQLALTNIEEACSQAIGDVQIAFLSALVHEQAGQRERALAELERAARGGYSKLEILQHPDLVDLRKDPLFLSISNNFLAAGSATKTN